ncbi:hypothetical protein CONPUDRAFT_33586, partial [Coniophora puteana RWD-64-598 SS2]
DPHTLMDELVREFTLNDEQRRAFRIVAEHSLLINPEPLRMFLSGPGGTGKSRVINALRAWFERRGQSRRFRLASYMGVAAKNIAGSTLHSCLSLNRNYASRATQHRQRELALYWNGVDYVFIDEVSMLGCNLMVQISEALSL